MSRTDPISAALEGVIERFAGLVRQVGLRHGLAESDLDELVQDVRIRMWRALADGEKIARAPASYVYRTAMSAAIDLIRRRRLRREEPMHIVDIGAARPAAHRQSRPDAAFEASETMDAVALAIAGLSESRRPVVRMYLAGYGREEIAELLGWSEAKTRNLLYRGLSDLRLALGRAGLDRGVAV